MSNSNACWDDIDQVHPAPELSPGTSHLWLVLCTLHLVGWSNSKELGVTSTIAGAGNSLVGPPRYLSD